jgi:hypothetical protein
MVAVLRRLEPFYQRLAAPVHVESLFRQAVSQEIDRQALGVSALAIVDGRFAIPRRHDLHHKAGERQHQQECGSRRRWYPSRLLSTCDDEASLGRRI